RIIGGMMFLFPAARRAAPFAAPPQIAPITARWRGFPLPLPVRSGTALGAQRRSATLPAPIPPQRQGATSTEKGLCDEAKARERTAAMRQRRRRGSGRGRGSVLQLSLPQREEGALRIGAYCDPALWEGDRAGVHLSTELLQLFHRGVQVVDREVGHPVGRL